MSLAPPKEEPPNEAIVKAKRLAVAFQAVFGQPGRRSEDQNLVWDALEVRACYKKPIFSFNTEGVTDPLTAAHRDGARTLLLNVERELEHARKTEKKTKPKIKR